MSNTTIMSLICAGLAFSVGSVAIAAPAVVSVEHGGLTIGNTTPAFTSLGLHGSTGVYVPWAADVSLNEAGSWHNDGFPKNGVCQFSALVQLINTGKVPATFTQYVSAGPLTAPVQNYGTYTLGAGQSMSMNMYLYLSQGNYPVTLRLDPGTSTLPSSQAYVLGSVNVKMSGTCGSTPTPTPTPTPKPEPKPEAKADLLSQKGITLGGSIGAVGGRFSAWGGTLVLTDKDVFLVSGGKCAFNAAYDMANTGSATSGTPFVNRLYSNANLIGQQSALSLNKGEVKQVATQMYLTPGVQTVKLMLDANNNVAESNENNNSKTVTVRVDSTCAPAPKPEPKADLVSQKGLTLGGSLGAVGGRFAAWGGTLVLTDKDVFLVSGGKCAVNAAYDMANVGGTDATASFMNRLFSDATLVGQQSGLTLNKGLVKQVVTQMYLKPGTQVVKLMLDAENKVAETNESNNSRSITVRVDSTCQPTPTPTPTAKK